MAAKKDILIIDSLADFERLINRDGYPYDINMMVMPGTIEDKHKNVDPEKGIPALRRVFNLVYLFLSGSHDAHLGADYRWLRPNDLVIVPENTLYASSHVRNCTGYCIHFKTEFIQPVLSGSLTDDFPFFDLDAERIINVTAEESGLLQQSFQDIIHEYERFSHEKEYLLRNYIHNLLLRIREIYRPHANKIHDVSTRSEKLAGQFKRLVARNFRESRNVRDYAELMHISAKYLCDVVKEVTGKTPREIINDVLLLEAKVLLKSTDMTLSQIGLTLRFDDQSHFSHFIKQHTGYTPQSLRRNL